MARKAEDIGLLVVHGMGEQKKLEHLTGSARELASFIATDPDLIRMNVDDESDGDGTITIDGIFNRGDGEEQVRLHIREVWWADLGIRGGLFEQAKFWFWGLGQWAAEAIRKGDPHRNTVKLMAMPRFAYQKTQIQRPGALRQLPSRLLLGGAGLLAFLTFFSWSAAKRVVSLLANKLPEPSLIFLFLGDVKIYQQAGSPGKGSMVDPDLPIRTTIRRRMVSAMTEVAAREDWNRWYIFAHSLGTVPAFNALQETELALPNYLTEAEWARLPASFKTDCPFKPEGQHPTTDKMMPRRPPWLADSAGISRRRLFERFAGFVTFGSPLDKFAAMWPRVVPLNLQAAVFPEGCEWVNLHDPTDPVAARLDAFAEPLERADGDVQDRIALVPRNFAARASLLFGLSHIRYFKPRRTRAKVMPAEIAAALVSGGRRTLAAAAARAVMSPAEAWARAILALGQVAALAAALAAAAGALLLAIGRILPDRATDLVKHAIGSISPRLLEILQQGGWPALVAGAAIMIALAIVAVLGSGLLRIVTDPFRRPHG
ncbi:MAG TPA: hypothetical protein VK614_12400 [Allosphingosinicella sp.]|nr:hypothetical protein [Allosphingosinicella sp.]